MSVDGSDFERRLAAETKAFGEIIRRRRRDLGLTQDQLALATGVGRRYLIELEAGKATGHLGRGLLVARAVGVTMHEASATHAASLELPEMIDEDGPDVEAPGLF